jgi:hypothetical protein
MIGVSPAEKYLFRIDFRLKLSTPWGITGRMARSGAQSHERRHAPKLAREYLGNCEHRERPCGKRFLEAQNT